jgi:hypothetical protein
MTNLTNIETKPTRKAHIAIAMMIARNSQVERALLMARNAEIMANMKAVK